MSKVLNLLENYPRRAKTTKTTWLIILFWVSIALCDLHLFVGWLWPETYEVRYRLWLSSSYKEDLSVVWYLYELELCFAHMAWSFIICMLVPVEYRRVTWVFFLYFISQFLFYIWNRNTAVVSNMALYWAMGLSLYFLVKTR